MQLQEQVSILNLALFWLKYGFSAKLACAYSDDFKGRDHHHDKGPKNKACWRHHLCGKSVRGSIHV